MSKCYQRHDFNAEINFNHNKDKLWKLVKGNLNLIKFKQTNGLSQNVFYMTHVSVLQQLHKIIVKRKSYKVNYFIIYFI